jgi:hypothetical protein
MVLLKEEIGNGGESSTEWCADLDQATIPWNLNNA